MCNISSRCQWSCQQDILWPFPPPSPPVWWALQTHQQVSGNVIQPAAPNLPRCKSEAWRRAVNQRPFILLNVQIHRRSFRVCGYALQYPGGWALTLTRGARCQESGAGALLMAGLVCTWKRGQSRTYKRIPRVWGRVRCIAEEHAK